MLYADNTGDARNRGFLGTGVAVFIVGFFLLIFGFGVGIVVCCKHRNNKDGKFRTTNFVLSLLVTTVHKSLQPQPRLKRTIGYAMQSDL